MKGVFDFAHMRQSVLPQKVHGVQTTITSCSILQSACIKPPVPVFSVQAMYDDYRNWFASTGLRGQLGRKQFANRVEAADITKSSRRSQGYFFMNVNLR